MASALDPSVTPAPPPEGVEVRRIDEVVGRGLFATRTFGEGEEMFQEDPFVSCQFLHNKAYGYSACDHCLRPMESVLQNIRRLSQQPSLCLPCPSAPYPAPPTPVLCPHCKEVYCSPQCRQQAWDQHHRTLCLQSAGPPPSDHPLYRLQESWRVQHFPPETMNIMLVARILASLRQSSNPVTATKELEQFCHALHRSVSLNNTFSTSCTVGTDSANDNKVSHCIGATSTNFAEKARTDVSVQTDVVSSSRQAKAAACSSNGSGTSASGVLVHKLLGEEFENNLRVLREPMEEALGASITKQWVSEEGFQSLVALVGSNGQGIGTSPLAQWVTACDGLALEDDERQRLDAFIEELYQTLDETVGQFLDTEGSGLYRLQSTCNHSCRPNATPAFPNSSHRLVMTALRDVAAGEQVTISYLDHCLLARSRHSRQAALRENYLFVCGCDRCEEERVQADITSDEESSDGGLTGEGSNE